MDSFDNLNEIIVDEKSFKITLRTTNNKMDIVCEA